MSISSLVIQTRPENTANVENALIAMDGVEVHTTTNEGQLVVTVDQPDDAKAAETFTKFNEVDGVINTSLIYNYFENDIAEKELPQ